MKRKSILLLLCAVVLLCVVGISTYRLWVKEASLTVSNNTPLSVVFVTYCRISESETVVSDRHELKAGEHQTFSQKFWGVEPNFAVFAHSADPELVRWIHRLPPEHPATLFYDGGVEEEDIIFHEVQGLDSHVTVGEGDPDSESTGPSKAAFVKVRVDPGTLHATHQIRDETFHGLYDREGVTSPEQEIDVFAARAQLLASVLPRQMKFEQKWPDPERLFPYRPGLGLNDHNGPFMPGVYIEDVAPMSIRGDQLSVLPGDVILRFGDGPIIFSQSDLLYTLYEHATSYEKGIEVPIHFEVIRNGERMVGKTTYFFNEKYWGYSSDDRAKAALYGFGDGVTLGFSVEAVTFGKNAVKTVYNALRPKDKPEAEIRNYKEEVWEGNQEKERLRQQYSDSFKGGAFVGMVCPGPGWLFKTPLARGLARAGLPKSVASLGAAATIEVIEGVVWTVADASPLQTPEQIAEDAKTAALFAAGSRVVLGSLTRRLR